MRKRLADMAQIQIGYQNPLAANTHAATHQIILMSDIGDNGKLVADAKNRIIPERNIERYLVRDGDVVFQSRGKRNLAFVLRNVPAATLVSNHFYIVRLRTDDVLPEYLAWFVNQPTAQSHLTGKAQGTTMMLVPKEAFESLEVDLPPLDVQRAIVELAELRQRERALVQDLEWKRDRLIRAVSFRAIARAMD